MILKVLSFALLFSLTACAGPSMMSLQAKSALSIRSALDESKDIIESHIHSEAKDAAENPDVPTWQAEFNAHGVIRKYDGVVIAHGRAISAYKLWTNALLRATKKTEPDLPLMMEHVYDMCRDIIREAEKANLQLPSLKNIFSKLRLNPS